MSVRFVPRTVPTTRLLDLKVGDLVRLDHPVERPLDLVSAGVVCARGVAGAQGPRAACLITESALGGPGAVPSSPVLPRRASE